MNVIYPYALNHISCGFFQQNSSITIKDDKCCRVSLIDDANFDHVPTQTKLHKINIHTHTSKRIWKSWYAPRRNMHNMLITLGAEVHFLIRHYFLVTNTCSVPPLIRIDNKFYRGLHNKARLLQRITYNHMSKSNKNYIQLKTLKKLILKKQQK